MKLRQFSVALSACSGLLLLPACKPNPPVTTLAPATINLSMDNNGGCTQTEASVQYSDAPVLYGQSASWCALDASGNKLSVDVKFPAGGSPFSATDFSANAGSCTQSSGPPLNAMQKTYQYSQVTVNGRQCNPQPDGVVVKPPGT